MLTHHGVEFFFFFYLVVKLAVHASDELEWWREDGLGVEG